MKIKSKWINNYPILVFISNNHDIQKWRFWKIKINTLKWEVFIYVINSEQGNQKKKCLQFCRSISLLGKNKK